MNGKTPKLALRCLRPDLNFPQNTPTCFCRGVSRINSLQELPSTAGTKQLKTADSSYILRILNPLEVSTGLRVGIQYGVVGRSRQYLVEGTTLEVAKDSIRTHFQRGPAFTGRLKRWSLSLERPSRVAKKDMLCVKQGLTTALDYAHKLRMLLVSCQFSIYQNELNYDLVENLN